MRTEKCETKVPPPRSRITRAAVPYAPSRNAGGTAHCTMHSIATLWCELVARFTAVSNPRRSRRILSSPHHCALRRERDSLLQFAFPGIRSTPRTAFCSPCAATPSVAS